MYHSQLRAVAWRKEGGWEGEWEAQGWARRPEEEQRRPGNFGQRDKVQEKRPGMGVGHALMDVQSSAVVDQCGALPCPPRGRLPEAV